VAIHGLDHGLIRGQRHTSEQFPSYLLIACWRPPVLSRSMIAELPADSLGVTTARAESVAPGTRYRTAKQGEMTQETRTAP
jgi:hypothetical protein